MSQSTAEQLRQVAADFRQHINQHHPGAGEFAQAASRLLVEASRLERQADLMGFIRENAKALFGALDKVAYLVDRAHEFGRDIGQLVERAEPVADKVMPVIHKMMGAASGASSQPKAAADAKPNDRQVYDDFVQDFKARPNREGCAALGHPGHLADDCAPHGWSVEVGGINAPRALNWAHARGVALAKDPAEGKEGNSQPAEQPQEPAEQPQQPAEQPEAPKRAEEAAGPSA